MSNRSRIWRGAAAGAGAGSVMVALMYLAAPLVGFKPVTQLLQEPILAVMPGPLFGLLIDRLQHLGKVVEEIGLILAMIAGLAGLGSLYALARGRFDSPHLGLVAAGIGWLLVVLVVLPLGGEGPLGLVDGVATPIAWALLFATYSVLLQALYQRQLPQRQEHADPGRRRLLRLLPLGLGAAGLGVLGWRLLPDWYNAVVRPPEAGLAGASPELTPPGNFYVISKNFQDPVVAAAGWSLSVRGLADRPLRLDLAALRQLPAVEEAVTLECISNNVGGPLMSTGRFTGVSLRQLLTMAEPRPQATTVAFHARDGYSESLPLSQVMASPQILLAYGLDGEPLADRHGFPARILIPGHYGMKGPKWLEVIDLVSGAGGGYWEGQGWDAGVSVKTTSRFDTPPDGAVLRLGGIALGGVAFAGSRGISAVEYSSDGGRTWIAAESKPPLSQYTWVIWSAAWQPAAAGTYFLKVRARDGSGSLQSAATAPSYPSGATGYHTIRVNVSH